MHMLSEQLKGMRRVYVLSIDTSSALLHVGHASCSSTWTAMQERQNTCLIKTSVDMIQAHRATYPQNVVAASCSASAS